MKQITLEKVRNTLRELAPTVEVGASVAARARVSIDRMLAVKV
jgi:quinolinate synthase